MNTRSCFLLFKMSKTQIKRDSLSSFIQHKLTLVSLQCQCCLAEFLLRERYKSKSLASKELWPRPRLAASSSSNVSLSPVCTSSTARPTQPTQPAGLTGYQEDPLMTDPMYWGRIWFPTAPPHHTCCSQSVYSFLGSRAVRTTGLLSGLAKTENLNFPLTGGRPGLGHIYYYNLRTIQLLLSRSSSTEAPGSTGLYFPLWSWYHGSGTKCIHCITCSQLLQD